MISFLNSLEPVLVPLINLVLPFAALWVAIRVIKHALR